jgi:hypothetical protein
MSETQGFYGFRMKASLRAIDEEWTIDDLGWTIEDWTKATEDERCEAIRDFLLENIQEEVSLTWEGISPY